MHKKFVSHDLNSARTFTEAEAKYFKEPLHKYFEYCRDQSSHFADILSQVSDWRRHVLA